MAKKMSKIRRGELQKAFLKAVIASGEKGIHFDAAMTEIEKNCQLTDYEKSLNPAGDVRWKVFMCFGVIGFYKFGYAVREKNVFWITEEGRRLAELSPSDLRNELKKRWDEREAAEVDEDDEGVNPVNAPSEPGIYLEAPSYLQNERTVFKRVDYDLAGLLHYIDIGDIGLPDIQRPFVWSSSDVRDLFDSMYRGFPVGYLLFWSNSGIEGTRFVGTIEKTRKIPHLLIVDGQQRLTSLYAVFRGQRVFDDNYKENKIEIAFRPRDGKFEVCDAAIRKDPEYIANISELWASQKSSWTLVNDFLKKLEAFAKIIKEKLPKVIRTYDLVKVGYVSKSGKDERSAWVAIKKPKDNEDIFNQCNFTIEVSKSCLEINAVIRNGRTEQSRTPIGVFFGRISKDPKGFLKVISDIRKEARIIVSKRLPRVGKQIMPGNEQWNRFFDMKLSDITGERDILYLRDILKKADRKPGAPGIHFRYSIDRGSTVLAKPEELTREIISTMEQFYPILAYLEGK